MDDKFRNKYRIPSARAQWWDYGWNGAYFITICTAHREHFFGEIVDGKMNLSPVGVMADIFWHEIRSHTQFVELGDFVVMPNHIHGILILDKPEIAVQTLPVETLHATSLPQITTKNEQMAKISPKAESVSVILRSYKSAVTKHANRLGFENGWQTRFHDHIIRDDAEYQRIADYIANNPGNWRDDKFYGP
ncbi:MAG: transposase [Bacteroidetes bacterium]|nr:transposase [Bacteroidota bacterium]